MKNMKKIKKIGIETEFSLILAIFLVFMIVSQTVLILYTERNIERQRQDGSATIARQIDSFLSMKIETLNRVMHEVQSDRTVAEILEKSDAAERNKLIEDYAEKIYEIQNYVSDLFYIMVRDEQGNVSKLTPNMTTAEREKLEQLLDESKDLDKDGEPMMFDIEGKLYTDHRYIYLTVPINRYDYALVGEIPVGRVAICMKVNMRDAFYADKTNTEYDNINLNVRMDDEVISLIGKKEENSSAFEIKNFYITNTGWEITGQVEDNTGDMLEFIKSFAYVNIVLTLLLMFLFRAIISNEVLKPVTKICEFLTEHGLNETSDVLEVGGNRDIKELARIINSMYERVRSDAHRIFHNQQVSYEREILNVETQLRLLQNQVNPHFIYNTFETIRSIADFYDASEICVIIKALNGLLRYNLECDSKVSIEAEIDIIKKYIEIMEIRYEDSFTFTCKCNEGAYHAQVLKMICQPLIENCFVHGFRGDGARLNITMEVTAANNRVILSIKDDGRGMSVEKRNELSKKFTNFKYEGNEVGISNLIYRLRLCYDNDFDFQILSEENAYTIININIPDTDIGGRTTE